MGKKIKATVMVMVAVISYCRDANTYRDRKATYLNQEGYERCLRVYQEAYDKKVREKKIDRLLDAATKRLERNHGRYYHRSYRRQN